MGILFIGFAIYHGWYIPYRVTLTEDAVILRARARQIVIPWADLYEIKMAPDRFSGQMRWAFGRGKVVQLTAEFNGLTPMLTEIRRRSPGTALP